MKGKSKTLGLNSTMRGSFFLGKMAVGLIVTADTHGVGRSVSVKRKYESLLAVQSDGIEVSVPVEFFEPSSWGQCVGEQFIYTFLKFVFVLAVQRPETTLKSIG